MFGAFVLQTQLQCSLCWVQCSRLCPDLNLDLTLGLVLALDFVLDLDLGFVLELVMPVGSPPSPQGHDKIPNACPVVVLYLLPKLPYEIFLYYSDPPSSSF